MQKILTLIIALLATSFNAFSAMTANDVLAKTANKFSTSKSISAKFKAVASDGGSASGDLIMSRDKFAMTSSAYGVWYNGTDMWSYYKESGEVSLTNPTPSELMESNVFEIVNQYSKHYKAKMVTSTKEKYVIALTAISSANSVKKATLTISAATWMPTAIDVTFSNGTTLKITVSNVVLGSSVPNKSTFEFPKAKYPNAEVIDLR